MTPVNAVIKSCDLAQTSSHWQGDIQLSRKYHYDDFEFIAWKK